MRKRKNLSSNKNLPCLGCRGCLAVKPCFARCLNRDVLHLILVLVCHVGIRLSLCELASLSAFRRMHVGRPAGKVEVQGRNRKPQLRERSESERVTISGEAFTLVLRPGWSTF